MPSRFWRADNVTFQGICRSSMAQGSARDELLVTNPRTMVNWGRSRRCPPCAESPRTPSPFSYGQMKSTSPGTGSIFIFDSNGV